MNEEKPMILEAPELPLEFEDPSKEPKLSSPAGSEASMDPQKEEEQAGFCQYCENTNPKCMYCGGRYIK